MYQLLPSGAVTRLSDGMTIPPEPTLGFWQDYLAWLADGNTPLPADVPEPQPVTAIYQKQALFYLASKGWLADFVAYRDALTGYQKELARSMDYAEAVWRIDNGLVLYFLMAVKGQTSDQVQQIFNEASQITDAQIFAP